jgi:hypothetical protein
MDQVLFFASLRPMEAVEREQKTMTLTSAFLGGLVD